MWNAVASHEGRTWVGVRGRAAGKTNTMQAGAGRGHGKRYNEQIHNSCSSQTNITAANLKEDEVVWPRRTRGRNRCIQYMVWVGKRRGKTRFEDLVVCGRIILKLVITCTGRHGFD